MAGGYRVTLEIRVDRGDPGSGIVMEQSAYVDLSFAKMTHISSEFYDLVAKLEKEKK